MISNIQIVSLASQDWSPIASYGSMSPEWVARQMEQRNEITFVLYGKGIWSFKGSWVTIGL